MTIDPVRYRCGCVNEHHACGALRSVEKCDKHRKRMRDPASLGREYFEELGAIIDGIPQCARYLEELREALGELPYELEFAGVALEIGPGCSMYAGMIQSRGYKYVAVEPCEWAARWTASTFDAVVYPDTLEGLFITGEDDDRAQDLLMTNWDLILAAHVFEHMTDSPGMIRKAAGLLATGGELWIIVPNDDDPLNPDHLWFWNEEALRGCVEKAGLEVVKFATRQRVKHEKFMYCRAVKR